MYWEVLKLPEPKKKLNETSEQSLSRWVDVAGEEDVEDAAPTYEPNPAAETRDVLFYPEIPGDFQLRDKWYMKKRRVPIVPAPQNTPMPDKQPDDEAKARIYSVYMRPWTLDHSIANQDVPHVAMLGVISGATLASEGFNSDGINGAHGSVPGETHLKRRRICGKQRPPEAWSLYLNSRNPDPKCETVVRPRSYAAAWSRYVRGNIVTEHSAKIIKQFMAANCGKGGRRDDDDKQVEGDADEDGRRIFEENQIPLERVHAILDRMSSQDGEAKLSARDKVLKRPSTPEAVAGAEDEADVDNLLRQSESVSDAMKTTAMLWSRRAQPWPETAIDRSVSVIQTAVECAMDTNTLYLSEL